MSAHVESSPDDFRSVLASVDKRGRRRWLHVHLVAGVWSRRRTVLSLLLIAFYLVLPFLTVGGQPALRIDLPAGMFWIAGHGFRPGDLSYLLLLLLMLIVGTLLAVALFGRVFCGWFCPHNVFLEQVFRRVERWTQGGAIARARAAAGRWTPERIGRAALKWLLFALIAGALANAMTALFTGTEAYRGGLILDPVAHPAAAVFWTVFFGLILFNFGWFREQTCTIVCPYGRLQSVMLDPHALTVAYDPRRGEPRRPLPQRTPDAPAGDCVDCKLCVAVCPTGIDIRNGNQLECLHCTACIDACDQVMAKIGRPRGLIDYRSEAELAGSPRRWLRPRTVLYAVVLAGLATAFALRLAHREPIQVTAQRLAVLPQYVTDADGGRAVRYVVPLALTERSGRAHRLRLELPPELGARLVLVPPVIALPADGREQAQPIIDVPVAQVGDGRRSVPLRVIGEDGTVVELPLRLQRP
jgi:cytochrome c oxidase accessory protein FixG